MQNVMDYLINEAQGAFIKNRSIIDNVLVCQSIVRGYKRMVGSPKCLMKLDLRKAYDTLRWEFIEAMLLHLNFPQFVQRIMVCVTMPRFPLMMNGGPVGYFPSKRGVRQGDPMSPYLFVTCMEYFSRLLIGLSQNPTFKFHPKCKALQLIHLVFADDMMLFSKADLHSLLLLKKAFEEFSAVSGLTINL